MTFHLGLQYLSSTFFLYFAPRSQLDDSNTQTVPSLPSLLPHPHHLRHPPHTIQRNRLCLEYVMDYHEGSIPNTEVSGCSRCWSFCGVSYVAFIWLARSRRAHWRGMYRTDQQLVAKLVYRVRANTLWYAAHSPGALFPTGTLDIFG